MTSNLRNPLKTFPQHSNPQPGHGPGTAAEAPAAIELRRRQEWFAKFAPSDIMPLLDEAAAAARNHGAEATSRLAEENGHLAAELVIVRGRLPDKARPPRLTVYATGGERPLMVEFTGTFPHVGATGGFGAEIDFDPIYPGQLKEKVQDFLVLAGAGAPRR